MTCRSICIILIALDLLKKSFNKLIFSSLALSGLYALHQHADLKLHSLTVSNTVFLPLIESTQHKKTCDTAVKLISQHYHIWNGKNRNCQTAGISNLITWRLKAFITSKTKFLCCRLELYLLFFSQTQYCLMICSKWCLIQTIICRLLQSSQDSCIEKFSAQLIYKSFSIL